MRTLASQMRDEEFFAEIDFPLNPYATYLFICFPESLAKDSTLLEKIAHQNLLHFLSN